MAGSMKAGTTELMKFHRLQRRLGESKRMVVGLLELLWQATAKNAPEGDIGRFTDEEIAILCDWESDPSALIDALVDTRWMDRSDTHRLVVHDWEHHCPTYIKGGMARYGKSFAHSARDTAKDAPKQAAKEPAKDTPKQPPIGPSYLSYPDLTNPYSLSANADGHHAGGNGDLDISDLQTAAWVVSTWNEHVRDHPRLSAVQLPVAESRRKKIKTRLGERCWAERFIEALDKLPLPESPTSDWQPDLWWLTANDVNVDKVREGKYEFRRTMGRPPEQPKGRSVLDD